MADNTRTSTVSFVQNTVDEIRKVTWPDQAQLQNSTGIIIVFMLLCAAVILVMDLGVAGMLRVLTSIFS